jgi:hypothetical protein
MSSVSQLAVKARSSDTMQKIKHKLRRKLNILWPVMAL